MGTNGRILKKKREINKMTDRPDNVGLVDLIDRILDKGLVINADIMISLAGTEILGIKLRLALASFETAAKYGLAFPSGTNLNAPAWKELGCETEDCPKCGERLFSQSENFCPQCGWGKATLKRMEVLTGNES
jgi:hypothetical protein